MNNTKKLLALSKIMPFQCGLIGCNDYTSAVITNYHLIDSRHNGEFVIQYLGGELQIEEVKPCLHPFSKLNTKVPVPNKICVELLNKVGIEVEVGDLVNLVEILSILYHEEKQLPICYERELELVINSESFDRFFGWSHKEFLGFTMNKKFIEIANSLHFAVGFTNGEFEEIE